MKTLWRRSATLLFRFPALALAVVLVAAIASITAVSGPLFIASTEIGSLREGVDQATRWTAGYTVTYPSLLNDLRRQGSQSDVKVYLERLREREAELDQRWSTIPNVEGPYVGAVGSGFDLASDHGEARGRLLFRKEALTHIHIIDSIGTDGLFIADNAAQALGVSAGDEIAIEATNGSVTAKVAGIYRNLVDQPPAAFWSPFDELIFREPGSNTDPPALVLVNRETYERIMPDLRDIGFVRFNAPLVGTELTMADLEATLDAFARDAQIVEQPKIPSFGRGGPQTALPGIVRTARERIATVTPVVAMLSGAATIIALSVAASAGFFLVKRRRTEVRTLLARGIGPITQGLRFGVESIVPTVGGTVAGAIIGFFMVNALGPASSLEPTALFDARDEIALIGGLTLAMLAAAASLAVWREEIAIAATPPGIHRWRATALSLSGAVTIGFLGFRMSESASAANVSDARLTIAPVLMLGAGASIAAVLLMAGLPKLAGLLRFRSAPMYLAARRLSGASSMTQVLVIAGAWALGIAVYGFTASASVDRTASAKSKVFVGSDFSALIAATPNLEGLGEGATHVTKIDDLVLTDGTEVAALAIRPETFAEAAFWSPRFSSVSLDELIRRLEGPRVQVLTTGGLQGDIALRSGSEEIRLDVVGTAESFPGMDSDKPLLVLSRDDLLENLGGLGSASRDEEIWISGSDDPEALLRQAGIGYGRPLAAERVLETPGLTSLRWLLGLLAAMGAAAAAISIVGLLLYLQARQRAALVSGVLTRRMGLRGRGEFLTWVTEVSGALNLAFLVAIAVGLPVSSMMLDRLDPRPHLFPSPIFTAPVVGLVTIGAILELLATLCAWRIKRSVDKADIAQVMRI